MASWKVFESLGSPQQAALVLKAPLWLVRLRHKLLKPSNDVAFERLPDRLFCWNSEHNSGVCLVCDSVVLGRNSLARTVPQTPNDAATSARRVYAMAASGLISTA